MFSCISLDRRITPMRKRSGSLMNCLSNLFFGAVYLYRSSTSAWWKKVDGAFDEAIREENESMKRAAGPAQEGLLQHGKEPVQSLQKAPEKHSIVHGIPVS
ncbi:hypothetical protein MMC11_003745 [Xylographa trunciseda]|nr:hypothetical protein [Xylographa trunciseda]